ncbi:MAG: HEPN domain-containing protein [Methanosarcina barkeri]|nr:HEPN domain-containing protein [Methanosarcina sp. ERenArc_MAG2]
MNTSVFSGFESLQRRFSEIDLILNYASANENLYDLYTSLCRSAQVLLIAHFEGAIKEFTRDAIDDFNCSEYEFKDSPKALKVTFCSSFITESTDQKFKFPSKLLDTFNSLPVKYCADAFLNNNHSDNNKTPNSHMVETVLEKFGVSNFLLKIENSDLDIAFQDSKSSQMQIRDKLKLHLRENVYSYPYTVSLELFNIHYNKKVDPKKKSMWKEFLDEVVTNRNTIAHGNSLESRCSHTEIEKSKLKIEILIYAYVLVLCKFTLPPSI